MMLSELSLVLQATEPHVSRDDYVAAIVEQNVLGKPTQTTRMKTAKRLTELYSLDRKQPVFRALRHFSSDTAARPLLAFLAAAARDPLLREATPFVLAIPVGGEVTPKLVEERLAQHFPDRFGPATLRSTSRNLVSTWSQAGLVVGKLNKRRIAVPMTPVVAAFAVFLGYLCGARGRMLFDTPWTRLLACSPAEITDLASHASRQGWLNLKAAGAVVEVTFPDLLTPQEERTTHVAD